MDPDNQAAHLGQFGEAADTCHTCIPVVGKPELYSISISLQYAPWLPTDGGMHIA